MRKVLISTLFVLTAYGSASAQWGARAGFSGDPDQIYFGAHWNLGQVFENTRFQPSVDIGLGDDIFRIAGNAALHYVWDVNNSSWDPYAGGELTLNYLHFDRAGPGDDNDTEFGLNAAVGIQRSSTTKRALNFELRLGLVDSPDIQAHVGWTF